MFCEGFQMAMPAPLKPLLYRLVLNSPLKSAIHSDYIIKTLKHNKVIVKIAQLLNVLIPVFE